VLLEQDLLAVRGCELHVQCMSEGESLTTAHAPESSTAAWIVPPQPVALTAFKIIGVAASSALLVTLFARIVITLGAGASGWLVLPAILLGYIFADLLSGTAHWFCDTFFEGACAEAAKSRALAPTWRPHPHARAPPGGASPRP
jgi:hypothetical protein